MFLRRTLPQNLQGKGFKICPGGIQGFYRKCCRKNFKKGSFGWKLKWLVPFLIVESDWKATSTPSTPTISPNTSKQNFEIPILFNAFESSGNYTFEQGTSPTVFRARVISYALGAYKFLLKSLF